MPSVHQASFYQACDKGQRESIWGAKLPSSVYTSRGVQHACPTCQHRPFHLLNYTLGKEDLARLPEESPGPREGAPCAQGHTDTEAGVRGRVTDPHTNPQRLDDTHPHERHGNVTPTHVTCRPRTLDSSG